MTFFKNTFGKLHVNYRDRSIKILFKIVPKIAVHLDWYTFEIFYHTLLILLCRIGAATILTGIGLFAYDRYKENEDKVNSNLELEPRSNFCF
ncbi:hypothetical protein [Legionella sp. PC997]|uniref:hypothetical protein n=1 Tax=Legionella sp. PC997 TaxID=2755562 RepID=UPI0015FB21A9|nr:hypothetical protein [Legionella sp. PC997]QMT59721.1 hypothetical protein HBNCFIEN_01088 [Legionella sp. PC997]